MRDTDSDVSAGAAKRRAFLPPSGRCLCGLQRASPTISHKPPTHRWIPNSSLVVALFTGLNDSAIYGIPSHVTGRDESPKKRGQNRVVKL
jgi:hypothetical protein